MNKHILLGISGGIAAYKSCELVRLLKKQGHSVTVAMSRAATEFVSPLTFQALSGNPVLAELCQGGVEDLLGAYFLSCWLASCRS